MFESASASASAPTTSKTRTNTQSPPIPHLELRILTSRVGLSSQPSAEITDDQAVQSAMVTTDQSPDDISYTSLLFGPLDKFLTYSCKENSRWLIDITHNICDPHFRCGSLKVQNVTGQGWRNVNPTDPLTASIYRYKGQ